MIGIIPIVRAVHSKCERVCGGSTYRRTFVQAHSRRLVGMLVAGGEPKYRRKRRWVAMSLQL